MLVELLALLAVLAALFVIGLKGNKKTAAPPPPPVASPVKHPSCPYTVIPAADVTLGEELGRGAFGIVRRATFRGRPACAKSLHATEDPRLYGVVEGSPEHTRVLADFQAEIENLNSLHNTNIVSIEGVVLDDKARPKYIILELAAGNLRGFARALGRPLTLKELKGIARDILNGLAYLHALGLVHRDIKPENLLVFVLGEGFLCKLGDIGLARLVPPAARSMTSGAGTVYYMAPEVMSSGRYDMKADMFALGLTLAEVVCTHMAGIACSADVPSRFQMAEAAVAYLKPLCPALANVIKLCVLPDATSRPTAAQALAAVESSVIAKATDAKSKPVIRAVPSAAVPAGRVPAAAEAVQVVPAVALVPKPSPSPSPAAPSGILAGSSILSRVDAATVATFKHALASEWLVAGVPTAPFVTELLYRGSRDGLNPAAFHAACDGKGPTLTLIRSTNGCTFGGYAGESWCSPADAKCIAANAFLFSVTGPHGNVVHFPPHRPDGKGDMWCRASRGPCFGSSDLDGIVLRNSALLIGVKTDAFDNKSRCRVPSSFVDTPGLGDASFTGAKHFIPEEVEVWAVARLAQVHDSVILGSVPYERRAAFHRALIGWLPGRAYTLKLAYRASRDGRTAAAFHRKCDGTTSSLVLVQCGKGWVFGGYAGASWRSNTNAKGVENPVSSPDAFLFSVTGPHTTAPVFFPVKRSHADKAMWCGGNYGPCFTGGLVIKSAWMLPSASGAFGTESYCGLGGWLCSYQDVTGRGYANFTGAADGRFTPGEIEVYAITHL